VSSLPAVVLVVVFALSAAAIWVAGIELSSTTDALDSHFHLGSAMGGLIILAIATNLPEIVITVSAATSGNVGLAVGNLLGGIAIQTLVLALLDAGVGPRVTLTYIASSLLLVIEGMVTIAVTVAAIMTAQLPSSLNVGGLSPGSVGIAALWVGGLFLISRSRAHLPWKAEAIGAHPGSKPTARPMPARHREHSFRTIVLIFAAAALVTLVAGVLIEESGSALASRLGMQGAVFGATILAAATALPEVSTGLQAVRQTDYQLAISDIFGGNAFLPVLFVFADLLAGEPALAHAQGTDVWIGGLGVVLTCVFVVGLVLRPQRVRWRLGPDSLLAIALYVIGIAGLLAIPSTSG
jgi:cation:H+ antiporter